VPPGTLGPWRVALPSTVFETDSRIALPPMSGLPKGGLVAVIPTAPLLAVESQWLAAEA
jgi:hypothetical protein